jgi:hypothetical protein
MKELLVALLMSTAPAWAPPLSEEPANIAAQSLSCVPRHLCTQIASCDQARWYLENCSWGHKLDGDGDGIPCEKLCGSSP